MKYLSANLTEKFSLSLFDVILQALKFRKWLEWETFKLYNIFQALDFFKIIF